MSVSVYIPVEYESYNTYQNKLLKKVKQLRRDGLNYAEIARWLNKNNYKTTRGKVFKNNHVHSFLKKGLLRHKRLKQVKMEYDYIDIEYPNRLLQTAPTHNN